MKHPIPEVNCAIDMTLEGHHTTEEIINEFIIAAYACEIKGELEQAKQCIQCAQYAMFGGYQLPFVLPRNNAGYVQKKYRKMFGIGKGNNIGAIRAIDLNS